MSSIKKLIPEDLTAIKNIIFKNYISSPNIKNSLFSILTIVKEQHTKLKLKDIKFTSDKNNYTIIEIFYNNKTIHKVIQKNDLKNIYPILTQLLK